MYVLQQMPPAPPVDLLIPTALNLTRSGRAATSSDSVVRFDLLGLEGLITVKEPVIRQCTVEIAAEQIRQKTYPACSCPNKAVKSHSPFKQTILDAPQGRKQRYIKLRRRRWRCKSCGATTTQSLICLAPGRYLMTQRLLEYVEVQSLLRTDLNVSEETGVSVRRVREIRKRFTAQLEHAIRFATPRVIGIDGVRADGHNRRVIFTDIEAGYVLDLIKSGSKKSIAARLKLFNACGGIQFVTIDMCRTLRAAVLEALPDAIIIIDLFHIMRLANQVMDAVRTRLYPKLKKEREPGQARPRPEPFRLRRDKSCSEARQDREWWFAECPELQVAYDLKEGFLELFDEKTYGGKLLMCGALARQNYERWLKQLPREKEYEALCRDFKKILTAMKNWGEYVFNYFDYRYTNAFTESSNRKIKDVQRDTRWCSFDTTCARAIYGTYLRKQEQEARAQEVALIRPPTKRRRTQQPAVREKQPPCKNRPGNARRGAAPAVIQMALDFTN